jgi:hypothetical protein
LVTNEVRRFRRGFVCLMAMIREVSVCRVEFADSRTIRTKGEDWGERFFGDCFPRDSTMLAHVAEVAFMAVVTSRITPSPAQRTKESKRMRAYRISDSEGGGRQSWKGGGEGERFGIGAHRWWGVKEIKKNKCSGKTNVPSGWLGERKVPGPLKKLCQGTQFGKFIFSQSKKPLFSQNKLSVFIGALSNSFPDLAREE